MLAFASWWLYFDHPGHLRPPPRPVVPLGLRPRGDLRVAGGDGGRAAGGHRGGHGDGDVRIAALAVAMPVAGYLLGLALVMMVTGTPPNDERVYPKFGGAAAVLVIGRSRPWPRPWRAARP